MRKALFAGSFDPFTIGHKSIVDRALSLFDEVIVAFGVNVNKKPFMPLEEKMARVREAYKDNERVKVVCYEGLTVDFAREMGVCCLVRGVRNAMDYEYERTIAEVNQRLSGVETVLLIADAEKGHVSSSLVREFAQFGKEIDDLMV